MRANRLVGILAAASPLFFALPGYAAESAMAAVQAQRGMVAAEHAGHDEKAGTERAAGAYGAGKPASWTAFPTLKARASGESRERRAIIVVPQGIVANSIDAYSNNDGDARARRQLPLDMAGAKLDKPESGGYHWLAAREEQADKVRVASTVHFFSERGAQNPTGMFMQQKHELEIIPQPFPREHSRYRSNEDWKFLVRFNGKPLAGQKVVLQTQNGTETGLFSDVHGVITVHVPDDFQAETRQTAAGDHSHGRRGSDFVLATEHAEGGKSYLTAFNGSYGPDAFDQRNLAMGLGFTLLGMMGAVPLLRQRKDAKNPADTQPAATEAANDKDA